MTEPEAAKLKPRPASTVLLLRESPLQVLMVRRRAAATFSSAWVFPGGLIDPVDASEAWLPYLAGVEGLDAIERANRIAALRELYEETGVFHAAGDGTAPGLEFFERVRAEHARVSLDLLIPFGHWITPEAERKRFDTRFYLCRALPDALGKSDGNETVAAQWMRPEEMIARAEGGDNSIMFPTHLNLKRLSESASIDAALAAARSRKIVTVVPTVEHRAAGKFVTIPAEAGYYLTERRF